MSAATAAHPTAADLADAIKREVLDLIADGTIPEDVPDFAALHDYVDANMLGDTERGAIETGFEGEAWDAHLAVVNEAQEIVHQWLKAGRPVDVGFVDADGRMTLPSGCTVTADTLAAMRESGTWEGWLDPRMYGDADLEWLTRETA